jgi:NAD(P)-dependent dehydrogenase (short-subunit alcohol dehydrogenase family)
MTTKHFDLDGKIAVVSGASRGIGASIAQLLARYGAHVVVCSRRLQSCQQVVDAIEAEGGSAAAMACNIGKLDDIESLFAAIGEQHGRVDILVNNAAANPYFGPILDTDAAAFQKTIDVNIRGYFFMSLAAAKLMRRAGGGAIVNIASVNGLKPMAGQGAYSLSKAAIINMTKAFALECAAFNIRCNAVAPGLTKTHFASALFENEKIYQAAMAAIPMHRHAVPDEIAGAVLYLASNASSYATGECLVVDGGMTI